MTASAQLRVCFGAVQVGTLEPDGNGRLVFTYAGTWLERPDAFAIEKSESAKPDRAERQNRPVCHVANEGT